MRLPGVRFRAHIWLERDDNSILLGPGRARLLTLIDEHGSLRKAAQAMGMSYRAAWGKLKETEGLFGQPLLEKHGHEHAGFSLTPFGREVLDLFLAVQRHVDAEAQRKADALLGAARD